MTPGGVILTGGPVHPMAVNAVGAVEAVRLDGRRITHLGSLAEARCMGDADLVDLDGGCLMPGFVDAHTPPLMHGQCRSWADLSMASSVDEVVKLLGEHARTDGRPGPIRGFGYDHHRLAEGRHPTAAELDMAAETRTTSAERVLGEACRITRRQAFEGYTRGGAHALRRDDVGSLSAGRLADLAILDTDPFEVATDRLPDVSVIGTWVDGRPAWTAAAGLVKPEGRPDRRPVRTGGPPPPSVGGSAGRWP